MISTLIVEMAFFPSVKCRMLGIKTQKKQQLRMLVFVITPPPVYGGALNGGFASQ